MPKIELDLQFEGAIPTQTLLMIAEQNEFPYNEKRYANHEKQIKNPTHKLLGDTLDIAGSWLRHPEDITRAVYDVGVSLSKQNVHYAEIGVNPLYYVRGDFTFEALLNALNDGRDRAERGWNVMIRWLMVIPRTEPRRADEVGRWATSATARKNGVVGLMLGIGAHPKPEPLELFQRGFSMAIKKELARAAFFGADSDRKAFQEHMNTMDLGRLTVGEAAEVLLAEELPEDDTLHAYIEANRLPLNLLPSRMAWVNETQTFPYERLHNLDTRVTLGSHMPNLYGADLNALYERASASLDAKQLDALVDNALIMSFLPQEERQALQDGIQQARRDLHLEHLDADAQAQTSDSATESSAD